MEAGPRNKISIFPFVRGLAPESHHQEKEERLLDASPFQHVEKVLANAVR